MPARPIVTASRSTALDTIQDALARNAAKVEAVIADLSKPHVDDKAEAKKVLARAKAMQKSLAKFVAAN